MMGSLHPALIVAYRKRSTDSVMLLTLSARCKGGLCRQDGAQQKIQMAFRFIDGDETHQVLVSPTTRIWKAVQALGRKTGRDMSTYRFLWFGHVLTLEETFCECNIQDGDCVEVMLQQVGC